MVNQRSFKSSMNHFLARFWFLPSLLLYIIAFWRSQAFVYIEGDDATSIAYHLLGRNLDLQLPYSPYQGMMDALLSIIPPQENLLRYFGFGLTSLACVCFGYLVAKITFDWKRDISPTAKVLIPFLILLASPELIYLGLSYKPTLIAIDLLLCSHLILRSMKPEDVSSSKGRLVVLGSILLFGLGVSFRWNTIVYGAVIISDIFFTSEIWTSKKKKTLFCFVWGVLAFISSLIAIVLSNINFLDLSHALSTMTSVANQVGTEGANAYLSMALALSPLFTPGMVILSVTGFFILIYRKDKLWIPVVFGLLGVLPFIRSGAPKNLITFIPVLALCFSVGFIAVWDFFKSSWWTYAARGAVLIVLIIPWIVGVRVVWGDTAWGPGFELQPFDRPEVEENQINIMLGSGSAFPTPGIPRPIYGYFDNLIGGSLKNFELMISGENRLVVDTALSEKLPILMTSWSPDFYVIDLYTRGFVTRDAAYKESSIASGFYERQFANSEGQSVTMYHGEIAGDDASEINQQLVDLKNKYRQVIFVGYPGTVRTLYFACPNAMRAIGSTSAILDLEKLDESQCQTN
jgi:hypothetical protein